MSGRRVVVVGAGIGGLAAAIRLAHAGYRVTVVEQHDVPGGRAGVWRSAGYTFDTGPSMVMMPDCWDRLFHDVGRRREDYVEPGAVRPLLSAALRRRVHARNDQPPRPAGDEPRADRAGVRSPRARVAGLYGAALSSRDRLHPPGHASPVGDAGRGRARPPLRAGRARRSPGAGGPVLPGRAAAAGGHVPVPLSRALAVPLARHLRPPRARRGRGRDLLSHGRHAPPRGRRSSASAASWA